jgi:murein DD-endopeptidase MepM/ murein hydrolase activator NlpD
MQENIEEIKPTSKFRILLSVFLLVFLFATLVNILGRPTTSLFSRVAAPPPPPPYKTITVQQKDTLAKILEREELSQATAAALLAAGKSTNVLHALKVNQEIRLLITTDPTTQVKTLEEIQVPLSNIRTLILRKQNDGYEAIEHAIPVVSKTEITSITIQSTLAAAIQEAGMPKNTISKLIEALSGSVNFSRDLRPGDTFILKYAGLFDGTKLMDIERIFAVQLRSQKIKTEAILYRDSEGKENYYTAQGKSLRASFLRWPILRGRISSSFNLRRKHPILGIVRPHTGTDFAAPYGTPIRATGNGVISFIGRNHGYGRVIMINHGRGYVTLYAHMSRFANKLVQGSRVKQGQTIGYIGSSGLADGPHVHYEVRINGKFFDPMKVKLTGTLSLSQKELEKFKPHADKEMSELNPKAVIPETAR